MGAKIDVDLGGKVAIVTGANTGIGKVIARELARLGAHVVLACRSAERGQQARNEIARETTKSALEVCQVDLSSQAAIRAFVSAFAKDHPRLDILVNNAGIWPDKREESVDGIELVWATNVLGYALLTELLLDRLKASAPSRIVSVASELSKGLDLDDVEWKRRRFGGMAAYAQSKQANLMWTYGLAKRLDGTKVTANVMHPGGVATELTRDFGGILGVLVKLGWRYFARTPAQGADTAVWLAASKDVEGVTGRFFMDRKERRRKYEDPVAIERLWKLCEAMTRTRPS